MKLSIAIEAMPIDRITETGLVNSDKSRCFHLWLMRTTPEINLRCQQFPANKHPWIVKKWYERSFSKLEESILPFGLYGQIHSQGQCATFTLKSIRTQWEQ